MTDPASLESLQDFISSPGWAWFSDYVTREWGPAGLRYQQAVREAAASPTAVIELQKVLAQQEAIYAVMRHPAEELKRQQEKKRVELRLTTPSRRGPGL